ncbi:MAG: glycosyltransferase family 2 protein [Chloroflexota bacterium]
MKPPIVAGIAMVRNEADIIRVNLQYHLSLGLDWITVVDNGSTDGTDRILQGMARDNRLRCRRDDSPYRQSMQHTKLAREAHHDGADWVLVIDADEFWRVRRGTLKSILARSQAVAIRAQVVNFVQSRDQLLSEPRGLLHATTRIPEPVGPPEAIRELVEADKIAHVEAAYPPKWITRPTADIEISAGNHHVSGIVGGLEDTEDIVCLHVPLRSRARMETKAAHGRRVEEAGHKPGESWHVRRFKRLQDEGCLDLEWAANSYQNGFLDVYGNKHPILFDPTLHHLLMPHLARTPWGRLIARLQNRLRSWG